MAATLVALVVLWMPATFAQPTVQWATVAGSALHDSPYDIALSPAGVIYVAGSFDMVNAAKPETVLHKLDFNGVLIGSQPSRGEQIRGVAVDAGGNYYLTGRVWDPVRLGRGKLSELYLGKFSRDGTLLWERTMGSSRAEDEVRQWLEGGYDVALDESGNIFVVGSASGSGAFGDVTFPDTPGGPLLCKFDPNGQLLWAKRVEGQHLVYQGKILGSGVAYHLALDRQGNPILSGYLFNGPTDFNGKVVNAAGPYDADVFIAKYSAGGEPLWVQLGYGYNGVAVDQAGSIYFNGNVAGNSAMQCGKFTPTGELVWSRKIPGAYGGGVALDAAGEPVFVGEFSGTLNLDGHLVRAVANTEQKILLCKAEANGHFKWAIGDTGQALTRAFHVVCDRGGSIYVAGGVSCMFRNGGFQCEPGELGPFPLTPLAEGTTDFFVSRVADPTALVAELRIGRTASGLALSWSSSLAGFTLESADAISAEPWAAVVIPPVLDDARYVVAIEATGTAKLFRLRRP